MFTRFTMAFAVLTMIGGAAAADDLFDEVAGLDPDQLSEVVSEEEDFSLAEVDVDGLAGEAAEEGTEEGDTDAIEACFRQIGYCRPHSSNWCWSYPRYHSYYPSCHNYYSHSYSYNYNYYCRPVTYSYANYCQPVCSYYWGCY